MTKIVRTDSELECPIIDAALRGVGADLVLLPDAVGENDLADIDAGVPRSKAWDEFAGQSFDLAITVCDQAVSESCPIFLGKSEKRHWSTPDPAKKAEGTEEEINRAFDDAFQMLKNRIEKELL
jgi:protein-tyrosine-phosphatase